MTTTATVINEKIKILVLGDSGVGKSSLVHLICHSQPIESTRWTIGCSIDIKIHRYKEGTPQEKNYFIEFWDVGGSRSHSIARKIFFNSFHGIILVQDLTNRKSEMNLKNWLGQAIFGFSNYNNNNNNCNNNYNNNNNNNNDNCDRERYFSNSISQALFPVSDDNDFEYDCESFFGLNIPILIVATKLDLVPYSMMKNQLIDLLHCDTIQLNCHNIKTFSPGKTNAVKLSRFLDNVCDKRLHSLSSSSSSSKISSPILPQQQQPPQSSSMLSVSPSTITFLNEQNQYYKNLYQRQNSTQYYLNKMN